VPECPTCGTAVAAATRFCPECGRRLPDERTGILDAPFRPRPWGAGAIAVVALGLAAGVLLATGRWAWGLVALLGAAVVVLGADRLRRGHARHVLAVFRERLAVTGEAMAVRSRGHVELFRSRRELAELEAERARLFHDLGQATYAEDPARTAAARDALDAVCERARAKGAEIERLRRETDERLERAQAPTRPTEPLDAPPDSRE
jgi:hypothetical protein